MIDRSDSHNITSHPDCAKFGYQIERELGHNKNGGRVTYLATNNASC
ncbi:hypothetical protein [Microseira wollei]|uniref:Serine/Threonine protein kinase n=1 Tax=Microseira wollei NIES-4236 TaxID=2530354 RepID=A0AAV3XB54_9CYAN|nr:hypothetical protein [Microseira wollei]GET38631.1 serine/Threonine protein kinase [Microseira wollei NIES-4236]